MKPIKTLIKTVFIFAVIALLAAAYARFVEPHRLISSEFSVENKNALDGFSGITIALFADTHFSEYYTLKDFSKVVNLINNRKPDMILFCGDLIDDFNKFGGDVSAISNALSKLSAPMGKFAVYGNHDHGGGAHQVYGAIMENGGFAVLRNGFLDFEDIGLRLIGIDDLLLGNGNISIVPGAADPGLFNLVFCHEADIVDRLLDCNVDLMVAGHSHGGQVNVFGYRHTFQPRYGRNYIKGGYNFDNPSRTVLYVNPGLGTTIIPIRFMAPPEVTFITIF